jgi:hypothetical protein
MHGAGMVRQSFPRTTITNRTALRREYAGRRAGHRTSATRPLPVRAGAVQSARPSSFEPRRREHPARSARQGGRPRLRKCAARPIALPATLRQHGAWMVLSDSAPRPPLSKPRRRIMPHANGAPRAPKAARSFPPPPPCGLGRLSAFNARPQPGQCVVMGRKFRRNHSDGGQAPLQKCHKKISPCETGQLFSMS